MIDKPRAYLPSSGDVTEALERLVREHGCPNSFSCAELAQELRTRAMDVGRSARNAWKTDAYGYERHAWRGRFEHDKFWVEAKNPEEVT